MRGIERVFAGILLVAALATTATLARRADEAPPAAAVRFGTPPRSELTAAPVVVSTPLRPQIRLVPRPMAQPPSTPVAPVVVAPVAAARPAPVPAHAGAPAPAPDPAPAKPKPRPAPKPEPQRILAVAPAPGPSPPPAPAPAQPGGPPYGHAWGHVRDESPGPADAPPAPPAQPAESGGGPGNGHGHAYGHDKQGFGKPSDE